MARPTGSHASYFVRIDTYWQGAPDRWVGPFASRAEAEAEIERALNAPGSKVCLSGQLAADVKRGIRVYGVASRSEAVRKGLRDWSLGDDRSNVIGTSIPLDTDELFELEQALAF